MSDKLGEQAEGMSLIGSRTLHRNTKDVLDHVQHAGESVVILRRGRPAAVLAPIDEEHAKAVVLASSPQLQESRVARAAEEGSESQPFAVAEREITGEEEAGQQEGDVAAAAEETNRLIQIAAERLMLQTGRFAEAAEAYGGGSGHEVGGLDASLIAIQQRNARALFELVEGFSEQTETLTALSIGGGGSQRRRRPRRAGRRAEAAAE
jgi:prevent-host-death family protein